LIDRDARRDELLERLRRLRPRSPSPIRWSGRDANVAALLIISGILNGLKVSPGRRIGGAAAGAAACALRHSPSRRCSRSPFVGMVLTAFARGTHGPRFVASIVLGAALISLILQPAEIVPLVGRIIVSQHVLALPNTPLGLPAKLASDWLGVPSPLSAAAIVAALSFAFRQSRWSKWLDMRPSR